MHRPERHFRPLALLGVWAILCLTLVSGRAFASMTPMAEVRPMAAMAMASPAMAMARMLDCTPCVRCYVAPATVAQGVGEESDARHEPAWRVRLPTLPDATRSVDTAGWHPRLPVRIAFCRWLD